MRIALAQINATVGALSENRKKIAGFMEQARRKGAELVLFPELALTGYPPEDLLLKPAFVRDTRAELKRLLPTSRNLTAVVGTVEQDRSGALFNAAAVLSNGRPAGSYRKMFLPNYGVFDEKRYFTPGGRPLLFRLKGRPGSGPPVGLSICEDIWVKESPLREEARAGARVLVNISASPYHAGKLRQRERLLAGWARRCRSWICYVNLVGGQDELVFDGASLVVAPSGRVCFRAAQFREGLYFVDLPFMGAGRGARPEKAVPLKPDEEIFEALALGLRDYVEKNGFSHVVIGMSGGIDSALTAAVAAAALGKGAVTLVSLPSRYSSRGTRADARKVARNLGVEFLELSIERMFTAALASFQEAVGRPATGVTVENLQARIRGTLLMALSNKFNWLVLATGNKSELSTGYCTLYGDMVGGFAVIKDVPKTLVYRLSRQANRRFGRAVIPRSVFTRPPSAELKAHQTDQETLPPYPVLDRIIRAYVEERRPAGQIRRQLKSGRSQVTRVLRMIDANEYKRRQAPPGIKITPLAFGRDRRMPITNRYREV